MIILRNIRDTHARERFWFRALGLLALLVFCSIVLIPVFYPIGASRP